jgi:hypothetical protein
MITKRAYFAMIGLAVAATAAMLPAVPTVWASIVDLTNTLVMWVLH